MIIFWVCICVFFGLAGGTLISKINSEIFYRSRNSNKLGKILYFALTLITVLIIVFIICGITTIIGHWLFNQ